MSKTQTIAKLLASIKADGYAPKVVERLRYVDWTMDTALGLIEAMGKERAPKFRIDDQNRWTYKQLIKWVMGDPTMQAIDPASGQVVEGRLGSGIYLCGATGTGKSWALELLAEFTQLDMVRVKIAGEIMRLWWKPMRADDIWEDCASRADSIQEYKRRSILCIQDLGAEPASDAVRFGVRREPLRQIIESRGDRTDCITLISSNFGICDKEIEARYTDRAASRLKEMCNYLVMPGIDRRTL